MHIYIWIQRSSSGVTQLSMEHYSINRGWMEEHQYYINAVFNVRSVVFENGLGDTKLFMYTCTAKHRLEVQVEKDSHMISITIPILIPAVLHSKSISSLNLPSTTTLWCGTLSKAFFKSNYQSSTHICDIFKKHNIFVKHDLALKNHVEMGLGILFLTRKSTKWSLLSLYNILQIKDVKLTGL